MNDPRDFKLDVKGVAPVEGGASSSSSPSRPFLSVQFACCSVYQRVYRDPDGLRYRGRCPRCGTTVEFAVGEGGTSSRSFIVR
jgi:hypothetical protein